MSKAPPRGLISSFQMKTMALPAIMPAPAPARDVRFQNSANSMTGPNVAPNPAQANETT